MEEDKRYTRTISTADFEETPRLVLEQPTGEVHVEGWDRPEIEVSIPSSGGMFEVEQSGSQVTIQNRPGKLKFVNFLEPAAAELNDLGINLERVASKVERKVERSMRRMGKGFNVNIDLGNWGAGRDYNIKVPHNCNITLRTSAGDLTVRNVTGTHFVQSTSGDIQLHDLSGNLLTNSASGDINIEGLEGKLGVRTVSGDIRGRRMSLQDVSATTASGDLSLELLQMPEKEYELKTVSGDVTIALQADARLTAEIKSLSGDISCGFPRDQVNYESTSRRSTTLSINGGGTRALISTVSGDITVRPVRSHSSRYESSGEPTMDLGRARHDREEDRARVEGQSRKEAELQLLQAVERGELSPMEAMQRLSELGRR